MHACIDKSVAFQDRVPMGKAANNTGQRMT